MTKTEFNPLTQPFIKALRLDDLPDEAWTYITGGGGDTDLQTYYREVSYLNRAIDILSNTVAAVPFIIYKGTAEFDSWEDYQNKVGFLPNPDNLLGLIEAAINIWGYAYLWKVRQGSKLQKLRYLLPTSISYKVDQKSGEVTFKRDLGQGETITATPEDIVYFWNTDPYVEIGEPETSRAQAAAAAAGVVWNKNAFAKAFFERGAIKGTLLTTKGVVQEEERNKLKAWWKRLIGGGIDNAWGAEVINADVVTAVPVGEGLSELTNRELQEETREDIATAVGIPHSILFSNAANFAVSGQDVKNLYDQTVLPDCRFIQGVLNEQVFTPLGYRFVFQPEALDIFQEDEEQRATSLSLFMDAMQKAGTIEMAKAVFDIFGYDISDEAMALLEKHFAAKDERREEFMARYGQAAPTDEGQGGQGGGPPQQQQDNTRTDLERWRTKAKKRITRSGKASCSFDSEHIPPSLNAAISGALDIVTTAEDVDIIINDAIKRMVWIGYP